MEQLRKRIALYRPEQMDRLRRVLRLSSDRVDRWVRGDDSALSDDEKVKLRHWARGDYAIDYRSEEPRLLVRQPGPAVCLGVRPPRLATSSDDYGTEGGIKKPMPAEIAPARRGKDLPEPGAIATERLRARQKEELEEQRAKRPKATVLGGLMTFGRG